MAPKVAAQAPATPVKRTQAPKDPGREHVARLNASYNLGVPLTTNPQTPADKEEQARADTNYERYTKITNILRFLHYSDEYILQGVLDEFDVEARKLSTRSPREGKMPHAQRAKDQVTLQNILLALLQESQQGIIQGRSSSSDSSGGSRKRNKGKAPEVPTFIDVLAKQDGGLAGDIDQTPVIPRMGVSALPSRSRSTLETNSGPTESATVRPRSRSVSTSSEASTSSAMYSALDSFEEQEPFDSQTTAEPDTEELWENVRQMQLAPSQESYTASEGSLAVLEESLLQYENKERQDAIDPSQYSDIPGPEDLRLWAEHGFGEVTPSPAISKPATFETYPLTEPTPGLQERLLHIFPPAPLGLRKAPYAIIWETTRIALRCGVDLGAVKMTYSPTWRDQDTFRDALSRHPCFVGMKFPEQSSQAAWDAALDSSPVGNGMKRVASYIINMGFNPNSSGPLYTLDLQPLATDLPHRLGRHFGCDRFVEVLFPSHHSTDAGVPEILRQHVQAASEVNNWLTRQRHSFAGRRWAAFFVKDDKNKKSKTSRQSTQGGGNKILQKRVYLFAEDGAGIVANAVDTVPLTEPLGVNDMLDWLLQYNSFPVNCEQTYLKLFSRIALGLSRTTPTIVFEPHQLLHRDEDLLSPTGMVMNDGVARMSLSVARKLRLELDLSSLPVAVQARIGSAKGMWILDTEDTGQDDWIETSPSQRKWMCDDIDVDHRTLEIRCVASEVRSANLNLQFLPLLEDRATDKFRMRKVLGDILEGAITHDLSEQRNTLDHPLLFSMWAHENRRHRTEQAAYGRILFLGGLPDSDDDVIQFLLAGGFDPLQQRFLWDKAYSMQRQRCEQLKDKLGVRVSRSAYLFMVVDFLGVLEEGEVQVCFSSNFRVGPDGDPDENGDDGSFDDIMLHDRDVLVARSPAHFTSDIQKVRAVFQPALRALKDVIVFSSKGNTPLAEKLSGGDYDGDRAWVCWDPRIVDNFTNTTLPPKYDLQQMGYMRKITTTVNDLAATHSGNSNGKGNRKSKPRSKAARRQQSLPPVVVGDMIERSFAFAMEENLLGKCTVYKERLCYWRRTLDDQTANILSTLLSDLVDQAKQGNEFTTDDFNRLRTECLKAPGNRGPPSSKLDDPAYKRNFWSGYTNGTTHIIDYLKFGVARPIVERELRALSDAREARAASHDGGQNNGFWDADLAEPAKHFEALTKRSAVCYAIFEALKKDLHDIRTSWKQTTQNWSKEQTPGGRQNGSGSESAEDPGFRQRVAQIYQKWCDIRVRVPDTSSFLPAQKKVGYLGGEGEADACIPAMLEQAYLADPDYSQWALLRASQTFRMFYNQNPTFLWRLAGRQLQFIKALMSSDRSGSNSCGGRSRMSNNGGLGGAKVLMTPMMFAAVRPDRKIINQITARELRAYNDGLDPDDDENDAFADDA